MDNFTISVALTKMKNAGFADLKGKDGTKRCIVIPVEDNPEISESSGNAYLNIIAFHRKEPDKFGNTHLLKGSWPKELREKMTTEEKFAQPIIGNLKPQNARFTESESQSYESPEDDGDLPF